jgi:signal peptidase I
MARIEKRRVSNYLRSRSFRKDVLLIAGMACFASSVFGGYMVPTGSMRPTILEGDCFVANKIAYRLRVPFTTISICEWSEPETGEIIVFKSPTNGRAFTKRVIGMPGDLIRMKNKRLFVNDFVSVLRDMNNCALAQLRKCGSMSDVSGALSSLGSLK